MFIIDFIMANYVWFLVASILILLSVIGSYAEKSNFGLDEKEETEKKQLDISELQDKKMSDFVDVPNKDINNNINQPLNNTAELQQQNSVNNAGNTIIVLNSDGNKPNDDDIEKALETINSENIQAVKLEDNNAIEKVNSINKSANINKEIEIVLPKKDIINTEILDDIDNLSFDDIDIEGKLFNKEDYYKYTDAIKFDDLKLPEIKSLNDTNVDIWKN